MSGRNLPAALTGGAIALRRWIALPAPAEPEPQAPRKLAEGVQAGKGEPHDAGHHPAGTAVMITTAWASGGSSVRLTSMCAWVPGGRDRRQPGRGPAGERERGLAAGQVDDPDVAPEHALRESPCPAPSPEPPWRRSAARRNGRGSARRSDFSRSSGVNTRCRNRSPNRSSVRSMRRMSIRSLPRPMIICLQRTWHHRRPAAMPRSEAAASRDRAPAQIRARGTRRKAIASAMCGLRIGLAAIEVGDRAGYPQHAMVAARAEVELLRCAAQQRAARARRSVATLSSSAPSASLLVRRLRLAGGGEAVGLERRVPRPRGRRPRPCPRAAPAAPCRPRSGPARRHAGRCGRAAGRRCAPGSRHHSAVRAGRPAPASSRWPQRQGFMAATSWNRAG